MTALFTAVDAQLTEAVTSVGTTGIVIIGLVLTIAGIMIVKGLVKKAH